MTEVKLHYKDNHKSTWTICGLTTTDVKSTNRPNNVTCKRCIKCLETEGWI